MRFRRVLCADTYSAQTMRRCALCACAHVRCCAACASAQHAHLRMCAAAPYAQRQRPSREGPKCIIFLRTLEREGESIKQQGLSSTREGNFCSMTFAKPTTATLFRVTQQKFSRPRANSEPLMRNAVTLDVLEHVRTCKFAIPAVRVDVRNPVKTKP